jgi:SSS family solute:Na+ symporter
MVSTTLALGATVLTLATFAGLGTWYARGRVGTVAEFVSAHGTTGGPRLAATLFASSMGAWVLLSPAEAGAAFGGVSAVAGYALGSAAPLLLYVAVGPRIRELLPRGNAITEFAQARYGTAMFGYVLVVSVAYMAVFLAAEMTGIVGALALVADVPAWQTAALVGGFALVYTGYGGLRASIFTDAVQTALLVPLLVVVVAGALFAVGGPTTAYREVAATTPSLVDPGFLPGLKFGGYIVFAVLGAEMMNQAWWQRIYAAESDRTLRRGFLVAAAAVVPLVFLAGLLGVAARGLGHVGTERASVALFALVTEAFPDWAALGVVLVALVLVMSTADTLFNALASVVTVDLPRIVDADEDRLLVAARSLTALVALGAVVVGAQQYSVLTLFLAADLLATATFVPLLTGLYSARLTGAGALLASVAGLAVGAVFFPPLGLFGAGDYLLAFGGATAVSAGLTAASAALSGTRTDLAALGDRIEELPGD